LEERPPGKHPSRGALDSDLAKACPQRPRGAPRKSIQHADRSFAGLVSPVSKRLGRSKQGAADQRAYPALKPRQLPFESALSLAPVRVLQVEVRDYKRLQKATLRIRALQTFPKRLQIFRPERFPHFVHHGQRRRRVGFADVSRARGGLKAVLIHRQNQKIREGGLFRIGFFVRPDIVKAGRVQELTGKAEILEAFPRAADPLLSGSRVHPGIFRADPKAALGGAIGRFADRAFQPRGGLRIPDQQAKERGLPGVPRSGKGDYRRGQTAGSVQLRAAFTQRSCRRNDLRKRPRLAALQPSRRLFNPVRQIQAAPQRGDVRAARLGCCRACASLSCFAAVVPALHGSESRRPPRRRPSCIFHSSGLLVEARTPPAGSSDWRLTPPPRSCRGDETGGFPPHAEKVELTFKVGTRRQALRETKTL